MKTLAPNLIAVVASMSLMLTVAACTPEPSRPSPVTDLVPAEVPHREPLVDIPALESLVGPHFPGAKPNYVSDSGFTATKIEFPLAKIDLTQAHGWKQISNGLSLMLLNDLIRLSDPKVRWAARHVSDDIPVVSLDPDLIENRLEVYRAWKKKLGDFAIPKDLDATSRLNLQADIRALDQYLDREIALDERDRHRVDLSSLLINPISALRFAPGTTAIEKTLRQLAPVDGPSYFLKLRDHLEKHMAEPSENLRIVLSNFSFVETEEGRKSYVNTMRTATAYVPMDEINAAAIARLETDLTTLGEWLRVRNAELAQRPLPKTPVLTEENLRIKYAAAGLLDSSERLRGFGEEQMHAMTLDLEAVATSRHAAPAAPYAKPLMALPEIRSSADLILRLTELSEKIDALLTEKKIITVPKAKIEVTECNVPGYPYLDKHRFCSNLVPAMFGGNYLFAYPIADGEPNPKVVFPLYDYLAKAAPQFLTLNTLIPLMAHEGRPGHELQFRGLENGQSTLARALFASHRTSVEGWALYAERLVEEAIENPDPLLKSEFLKLRRWRAARVILENRLYRGEITQGEAVNYLVDVVGLDRATAEDEVTSRYMNLDFASDASYLVGYQQLLDLRANVRRSLGERYSEKAFNDAVVKMGFLSAAQIEPLVKAEMLKTP